jgi:hypothetical protein
MVHMGVNMCMRSVVPTSPFECTNGRQWRVPPAVCDNPVRGLRVRCLRSALQYGDDFLDGMQSLLVSSTPSKLAVVPMATPPPACQKMFLGSAPPARITRVALAWVICPAIWNIQTSFGPPKSVTLFEMSTLLLHL